MNARHLAISLCLIFAIVSCSVGLSGCGKDEGGAPLSIVPIPVAPVQCSVYDLGSGQSVMPNFNLITPAFDIALSTIDFPQVDEATPFAAFVGTPAEALVRNFGLSCTATFKASRAGNYKFTLTSDDGSAMYLNGIRVINNDGPHGMTAKSTTQALVKGSFQVRVDYFENQGPKGLTLLVTEPAIAPHPL